MKHIITIASQQYSADKSTKEAYQGYMQQLKKTIDDDDQLRDIQARIVELLAEHNVKPGDQITEKTLSEVFTQLGGPQSFESKPIVDIAQHQRIMIMRTLGAALLIIALMTAVFTVASITAQDGNDDFPTGFAEWLYAIAGVATVAIFAASCTALAVGLIRTRFTPKNKKISKILGQSFIGGFIITAVAALIIAATN